jgi:hypothetical protein
MRALSRVHHGARVQGAVCGIEGFIPFRLMLPAVTVRGRPRTNGSVQCARCGRNDGKARATWPEVKICGPCFTVATRTHGTCPECGQDRLLPGA